MRAELAKPNKIFLSLIQGLMEAGGKNLEKSLVGKVKRLYFCNPKRRESEIETVGQERGCKEERSRCGEERVL